MRWLVSDPSFYIFFWWRWWKKRTQETSPLAEFLQAPGRAALALSSRAGEETTFFFCDFWVIQGPHHFLVVLGGSVLWLVLVGWYGLVIDEKKVVL